MVRELTAADTEAALTLLCARPLQNVFLEHVIRSGVLGRVPGFFGAERDGRLAAVLMIGPQGGTALEVVDPRVHTELAEFAAAQAIPPRHVVGSEDVTEPFWRALEPRVAGPLLRSRREPVFRIDRAGLAASGADTTARLLPARDADLPEVVMSSARQHIEDLGDDRYAADPEGFRLRHESDIRERRWWVLREERRICFQVHVGPSNARAVQIGGVFTVPDLRGRGVATRGMAAMMARLLESHPLVILYCGEENSAARQVYEKIGMRVVFANHSYLLADPASCSPAYA